MSKDEPTQPTRGPELLGALQFRDGRRVPRHGDVVALDGLAVRCVERAGFDANGSPTDVWP